MSGIPITDDAGRSIKARRKLMVLGAALLAIAAVAAVCLISPTMLPEQTSDHVAMLALSAHAELVSSHQILQSLLSDDDGWKKPRDARSEPRRWYCANRAGPASPTLTPTLRK